MATQAIKEIVDKIKANPDRVELRLLRYDENIEKTVNALRLRKEYIESRSAECISDIERRKEQGIDIPTDLRNELRLLSIKKQEIIKYITHLNSKL